MKAARRALIVVMLLVSVGACVGGGFMIADPSGTALGLPPRLLTGTFFADWLVPGMLLVAFVGAGFLFAAALQWRFGTWGLSMLAALGLMAFLAIEFIMIGFHPLQVVFGATAVVIAVLALLARSAPVRGSAPEERHRRPV